MEEREGRKVGKEKKRKGKPRVRGTGGGRKGERKTQS